MIKHKDYSNLLQFVGLKDNPSLSHFSTTIAGGVSEDAYESFNLGFYSGDIPERVLTNRSILANSLNIPVASLYIPYQTHEDKICVLDKNFLSMSDEEKSQHLNGVDALITNEKGIGIGITTADCVPVLIYDANKHVLAAVHAGWKGTVASIVEKTVIKMMGVFGCKPQDMKVGIAPCISQRNFEVGEEVVSEFRNAGFFMVDILHRNTSTGKGHIDLRLANKLQLLELGVEEENIEVSDFCTFSNPDKFFSARRQTIHSGRMVTGGVLR